MLPDINQVKGVHPGAVLKRELKKRKVKSVQLAQAIDEYPQTINAITKERRGINPKLSAKLGEFFKIDLDYFMILQASYEVKKVYLGQHKDTPSLAVDLRQSLFWDTKFERIDWQKNKRAVIKRVFERGNKQEIEAVLKFYGVDTVQQEVAHTTNTFSPTYQENVKRYLINPHEE